MSTRTMENQNICHAESVVAIFDTRDAVEEACLAFQRHDFEMTTISLVCRDHGPKNDAPTYFDSHAVYPRDLWGMQFGFVILAPQIGTVFIAGSIAVRTAYGLEATFGSRGFDQLSASLGCVGVPSDCCGLYESELQQGRILLIVDGSHEHVAEARLVLAATQAVETTTHDDAAANGVLLPEHSPRA